VQAWGKGCYLRSLTDDRSQTAARGDDRPSCTTRASALNHDDIVSSWAGMGTLLLKAGHVGAAMTVDALSADVKSVEQRILTVADDLVG